MNPNVIFFFLMSTLFVNFLNKKEISLLNINDENKIDYLIDFY